jgi:hypothetical protein
MMGTRWSAASDLLDAQRIFGHLFSATIEQLEPSFDQSANCFGSTRKVRLMRAPIIDGSH